MSETPHICEPRWYAIRTRHEPRAEDILSPRCDEVFFPAKVRPLPGGKTRRKALIPHVLFIRTTRDNALLLEHQGRTLQSGSIPFWIFRYPNDPRIAEISQKSIDLLRLLTAEEGEECQIYAPKVFTPGEQVRVIGGLYEGYEGFVKRINRDRRVVVEIEGVCMVILPFIEPELLEKKKDGE